MFKLEFETSNAAYQDGEDGIDVWLVADSLLDVARDLQNGFTSGRVHDANGNHVGHWELSQ